MGHSLNRTNFRINQNLVIDDKTFNPGYILVSDENGLATWKDPNQYIPNDEPLDRFIGELYGGGIVVAVWREVLDAVYERTLIASVKDYGVFGIQGFRYEQIYATDFSWSWSGVTNTLIGATAQYHSFGASNSRSIASQDPFGTTGSAANCLKYTNEDLHGLGVYSDWYLPSTFELNCLANNSAIVNRVIAQYAADKSIRLSDEDIYTQIFDPDFGGYLYTYLGSVGASMSLFLNSSPGYWTSTEYNRGSAYYLNMGSSGGVRFATASKSNALLNVRPFRQDVKRWDGEKWIQLEQGNRRRTGKILITHNLSITEGLGPSIVLNITNIEVALSNTVTYATYSNILNTDISIYDHIWDIGVEDPLPENNKLTTIMGAKYTTYLQNGGGLFILGENNSFNVRNQNMADFINGLGGGPVTTSSVRSSSTLTVKNEFLLANTTNTVTFADTGSFGSIGTGTAITTLSGTNFPAAVVWKTESLSLAPAGAIVSVLDINWLSNYWAQNGYNSSQFASNVSQILNKK